jgi:hypothetical protein
MPISFSCVQCNKDYVVSDALAGKRAVCKACGNRMTIPGDGVAVATVAAPAQPARPRPAAPAPRSAQVYEPAAEDLYGFDEAPSALPPLAPRVGSGAQGVEDEGPLKKKKKRGFFSGGSKKKSSGGSFRLTGIGGVGGWVAVLVVFGIISGLAGFRLIPKGDVEKFHKTLIQQRADLLGILKTVKDVPTAKAASARTKALVTQMTKLLEVEGHKKGRVNDIKELNQKYQAKHQSDVLALIGEFARMGGIPGAVEALDIQAEMNDLDRVEKSLQAEAAKQGLN